MKPPTARSRFVFPLRHGRIWHKLLANVKKTLRIKICENSYLYAPNPEHPTPPRVLNIILIEDQLMVAEGIAALLRQQTGLAVTGIYPNLSAVFAAEPIVREADLALVDFHLGESESANALTDLRRRFPGLRCLWLTGAVSDASLHRIERLKLEAFVHKDDPPEHLLSAISEVAAGRTYQSPTARRLVEGLRETGLSVPKMLSEREQEVMALIGRGLDNQDIGTALGLSASTVQTHRRNIMGKLKLRTSVALQAYAQQNGYVSLPTLGPSARA